MESADETVVVNCCQCIFPRSAWPLSQGELVKYAPGDIKDPEEAQGLLQRTLEDGEACKTEALKSSKGWDLMRHCNRSLDIFKGVNVIFMTMAHVDLTLMNPALQVGAALPHFVGNVASGLCFLGFMGAYGFSCDNAYLSDSRPRTMAQRLERVARSALMPVFAAWTCSMAWGYMCWKFPLNLDGLIMMLDFRLSMGNGPDFLLCFTFCLLAMYPLRHWVNYELGHSSQWRRIGCAAMMLLVPLALTRFPIQDCTGVRKYWGYLLECTNREAYAPVLPALPHLFYFNLGVLLCRYVRSVAAELKAGREIDMKATALQGVALMAFLLVLSWPLMTVWSMNYGNLMVQTRWGMVTRGFMDGPSALWLVGNLFMVLAVFSFCFATAYFAQIGAFTDHSWLAMLVGAPLRLLLGELEHFGANVLMYLVVGDVCLAGMWRGSMNQYPLDTTGCVVATLGLFFVTRFLHYLGASSRQTGVVMGG